jgi:hypothetical protein
MRPPRRLIATEWAMNSMGHQISQTRFHAFEAKSGLQSFKGEMFFMGQTFSEWRTRVERN